jgi:hypothetical protein
MLGRASAEPLPIRLSEHLRPVLNRVGTALADYFRGCALALATGRTGVDLHPPQGTLDACASELAAVRRAAIATKDLQESSGGSVGCGIGSADPFGPMGGGEPGHEQNLQNRQDGTSARRSEAGLFTADVEPDRASRRHRGTKSLVAVAPIWSGVARRDVFMGVGMGTYGYGRRPPNERRVGGPTFADTGLLHWR